MPGNLHKGLCFEEQAGRFLASQGLHFLQQGYRCRFGEIDLIMRDRDTLCFIEVKYRKSMRFGGAAYSLTPRKQHKLVKSAHCYITTHPYSAGQPMRFDALLIQGQPDGRNDFNWIKNAF